MAIAPDGTWLVIASGSEARIYSRDGTLRGTRYSHKNVIDGVAIGPGRDLAGYRQPRQNGAELGRPWTRP